MKSDNGYLNSLFSVIPSEERAATHASFEVSNRIDGLMKKRGLTKKQFADQIGRRPSEITRWLSGEHNFTIATLSMIAEFFGEPIIQVVKDRSETEPH